MYDKPVRIKIMFEKSQCDLHRPFILRLFTFALIGGLFILGENIFSQYMSPYLKNAFSNELL